MVQVQRVLSGWWIWWFRWRNNDASYNELKDDIVPDLINEKIDDYLFDVPEKVIGISHEEVILTGGTEIDITWH